MNLTFWNRSVASATPSTKPTEPPAREPVSEAPRRAEGSGVELFATGWQTALNRAPKVETLTLPFDPAPVRAISVRLPKLNVKTISMLFPDAPAWREQALQKQQHAKPKSLIVPPPPENAETPLGPDGEPLPPEPPQLTRVKPPRDAVKLEDRLYYVLQPPLQTLVKSGVLHMPFEPFPYQYEGIAFLYSRYSAVLADEMGLGKTMQAITAIRLLLWSGEVNSVLLICPKPLVTNWKREFTNWAQELPLAIIEGDRAKREWLWKQSSVPVKIANYELLMRDRDLVNGGELKFDLVVLDEAQRVKNRLNTTSEIIRAIPRSRNWALTGTPVENHPDDLVGIFEFLSPGYLKTGMEIRQMAKLTKDYIIRRTKDLVLKDMPPKMFRDADLELSPEQFATYKTAEDDGVIQLNDMGDSLTIQHVFELVLRLKQICNFDPVTGASSKMERLVADMEEVADSGQKAIVFTQWVHTLKRMTEQLTRFQPLEYHGQIPSKHRDGIIDRFKTDPSCHVLLMSYGAGSVGLNLQFCRYVFLFDRWWNPAIEDQAINRAHRIGAAGSVTVTRMVTLGTIEERIHQVLEEKRKLFEAVFAEAGTPPSLGFSQKDIFGLFNLRTPKGPLKAAA